MLFLELPEEVVAENFGEEGLQFHWALRTILPLLTYGPETFERYVAIVGEPEEGWIHTPIVVLSQVSGPLAGGRGGHNLDARVSRFRSDTSVARGKPQVKMIDGEPVIVVHPADQVKLGKIVRTVGKNLDDPKRLTQVLRQELPTVEPPPQRKWYQALLHAPPPPPNGPRPPRGATFPESPKDGFGRFGSGWHPEGKPSAPVLADLQAVRKIHPRSILVERLEDATLRVTHSEKGTIRAYSREDATDLVLSLMAAEPRRSEPMHVHLAGLSTAEARGFLYSARVRAAAPIRGRLRKAGVSIQGFNRDVARSYDFSKARVGAQATVGDTGISFTIEVPPRADAMGVRPGKVRSWLKLRKAQAADALNRLMVRTIDRVRTALGRSIDVEAEPLRLLDDVERELRTLEKETGIEFEELELKFESDMGDFYWVRIERGEKSRDGIPA